MSLYVGNRMRGRCHVFKDGCELLPERSLRVRRHSPDGFEWGYGGSGPAQLALAILLEETDQGTAQALYKQFKRAFVVAWEKEGFSLTSEQIRAWLTLPDLA